MSKNIVFLKSLAVPLKVPKETKQFPKPWLGNTDQIFGEKNIEKIEVKSAYIVQLKEGI